MRVTLEQSGGFAGLMITRTIDTQDLSPSEAQQLEQLVNESNFFQLTSTTESSPQPDRFQYQFSIDTGEHSHSIQIGETNIPEQLRPLLTWVQAKAR